VFQFSLGSLWVALEAIYPEARLLHVLGIPILHVIEKIIDSNDMTIKRREKSLSALSFSIVGAIVIGME
jgi:hypothetical protein